MNLLLCFLIACHKAELEEAAEKRQAEELKAIERECEPMAGEEDNHTIERPDYEPHFTHPTEGSI